MNGWIYQPLGVAEDLTLGPLGIADAEAEALGVTVSSEVTLGIAEASAEGLGLSVSAESTLGIAEAVAEALGLSVVSGTIQPYVYFSWDHVAAAQAAMMRENSLASGVSGWITGGTVGSVAAGWKGIGQCIVNPSDWRVDLPGTEVGDVGIVHVAFQLDHFTGDRQIVALKEGSTIQVALYAEATTGKLKVATGPSGGGPWVSTGAALSTGTWYSAILAAKIHDSAGAFEVKLDGISDASLTVSGVDTQGHGSLAMISRYGLDNTAGRFDDMAIRKGSASFASSDLWTFSGLPRMVTLFPDADGNYTAWTPNGAVSSVACVDDAQSNADTDYISATADNAKASVTLGNLPSGVDSIYEFSTIIAVRDNQQQAAASFFLRIAGVDYTIPGDNGTLPSTAQYEGLQRRTILMPDDGLAPSVSDVNALEIGIENLPAFGIARCTQMVAVVLYAAEIIVQLGLAEAAAEALGISVSSTVTLGLAEAAVEALDVTSVSGGFVGLGIAEVEAEALSLSVSSEVMLGMAEAVAEAMGCSVLVTFGAGAPCGETRVEARHPDLYFIVYGNRSRVESAGKYDWVEIQAT